MERRYQKGRLAPRMIVCWTITNIRAMQYYPISKVSLTVGLAISNSVVMNQRRNSKGTRVGTFMGSGGGGRGFAGSGISSLESTSRTYGDLVFYLFGHESLRFNNISDPQGVRRMVEGLKRMPVLRAGIVEEGELPPPPNGEEDC